MTEEKEELTNQSNSPNPQTEIKSLNRITAEAVTDTELIYVEIQRRNEGDLLHKKKSLYEKDFVAWSDEQALLLEQQRYEELDLANLVEEVKDLGNRHRDAIESQLTRLLIHLLKYAEFREEDSPRNLAWQYQEEKRSGSWTGTIKEARKQIARLIRKHPVLNVHIQIVLEECYIDARVDAADETGLPITIFPLSCPYWLKGEVLNPDFLPTKES